MLDTANTILASVSSAANAGKMVDATGDIYGLSYLQWRKLINTYKLRILISLSKRADDNADLNIKTQFANIINDPVNFPIMTSNSDNMVYRYTAVTLYPPNRAGYAPSPLKKILSLVIASKIDKVMRSTLKTDAKYKRILVQECTDGIGIRLRQDP